MAELRRAVSIPDATERVASGQPGCPDLWRCLLHRRVFLTLTIWAAGKPTHLQFEVWRVLSNGVKNEYTTTGKTAFHRARNASRFRQYYLVGIGGAGMGGIAEVLGYTKGIRSRFRFSAELVTQQLTSPGRRFS